MSTRKLTAGSSVTLTDSFSNPLSKILSGIDKIRERFAKAREQAQGFKKAVTTVNIKLSPHGDGQSTNEKKPEPSKFFKDARSSIDDINAPLKAVGSTIKNLTMLLAGTGGVTYMAGRFSQNLSDNLLDLNVASRTLNLPVSELRRFSYAAEASGVSTESLGSSLMSVKGAQYDAKHNFATPQVNAIAALQLNSLLDPTWATQPIDKAFKNILNAIAKNSKNPMSQKKFLSAIFGSDDLMRVMTLGPDQFFKNLSNFKVDPLPPDSVGRITKYLEASAGIKKTFEDLKYTVGTELMSTFGDWLKTIKPIIEENKQAIKEFSLQLATDTMEAIKSIINIGKSISETFGIAEHRVNLVKIALGGIATSAALSALASLTTIGGGLVAAASSPLAVPLAGAAVLGAGVYHFKDAPLKPAIAATYGLMHPYDTGKSIVSSLFSGKSAQKEPKAETTMIANSSNNPPVSAPQEVTRKEVAKGTSKDTPVVVVDFRNVPRGVRVEKKGNLILNVGYQEGNG